MECYYCTIENHRRRKRITMWIKDCSVNKLCELVVLTRKDLVKNGKSVIPLVFYVHGFHTEDVIEQHESEPGDDFIGKWEEWLDGGRIYVDKPKTIETPKINEDLLI